MRRNNTLSAKELLTAVRAQVEISDDNGASVILAYRQTEAAVIPVDVDEEHRLHLVELAGGEEFCYLLDLPAWAVDNQPLRMRVAPAVEAFIQMRHPKAAYFLLALNDGRTVLYLQNPLVFSLLPG